MLRKTRKTATAVVAAAIVAAVLAAAPAFAQGLAAVEPTLAECRAFVDQNGVPAERPVWENRGYSGWDVCLNMAYDGDPAGSFAAADTDGDGRLAAAEQAAYMDSVIGPVSDPDQSPLTLDKCATLVSQHGIPAERPFVDWSNRGYGEAEICQSLAFDGTLGASFAAADANSDGRLDRTEQSSYIASISPRSPSGAASATNGPVPAAQDEDAVQGQYGTSAAGEQYGTSAGQGEATAAPTETTAETAAEPTISAAPSETAAPAQPAESAETAESAQTDEPETGVLSAVNDTVERFLPDTGGVPILGVLGGVALLAGGLLAYRLLR